jgi:hypothetical protein
VVSSDVLVFCLSSSQISADIVIVDAKSDLNVYTNMAGDAQVLKRAATGCCKPSTHELSPSPEGQRCCTQNNVVATCSYEAENRTNACCDLSCSGKQGQSREDPADDGQQGAVAEEDDFSHVDINEWAGKCLMRPADPHAKLHQGSFKVFAVKK